MRIQPISYINEDAPVITATPKRITGEVRRLWKDEEGMGVEGRGISISPYERSQTNKARPMLINPAPSIVPGSPNMPMSTNPLVSIPTVAPILLVKYSMAMVEPDSCGKRRIKLPLIRGKVIPSKMD
jgi:hypothetical protein